MDQRELDRLLEKTSEKIRQYEKSKNTGQREKMSGIKTPKEIAVQIDGWISRPAIMKRWRKQIEVFFETASKFETQKDTTGEDPWPWAQNRKIELPKDMPALYVLLGFAHDDLGGIQTIITEKIKSLYPKKCMLKHCQTKYVRIKNKGGEHLLQIYFNHIEKDLEKCGLLPEKSETKILSKGGKEGSAKRPKLSDYWAKSKSYKTVLAIMTDLENNGVAVKDRRQVDNIKYKLRKTGMELKDSADEMKAKFGADLIKFAGELHYEKDKTFTKLDKTAIKIF